MGTDLTAGILHVWQSLKEHVSSLEGRLPSSHRLVPECRLHPENCIGMWAIGLTD